jgi:SAM-dependent methyltransferase
MPKISKFLPSFILDFKRKFDFWKYRKSLSRFDNLSINEVFSKIYKDKLWGGSDDEPFNSGLGTISPNTTLYIDNLLEFIKDNKVQSIVEIGCGDFKIMSKLLSAINIPINYDGFDVVEELINFNTNIFGTENIRFHHYDGNVDAYPSADMLIVRQVLQHLDNSTIKKILDKSKDYRFVIITEHLPSNSSYTPNLDKRIGPDIRIYNNSGVFIEEEPFNIKIDRVLVEYQEDTENFPAIMRTTLSINP